jgi:hypothetical protein
VGAGFVVSDRGAAQWSVPDDHTVTDTAAIQRFQLLDGLALQVERRAGDRLRETYRWANTGDSPLRITSLAVSTPWRDVYAADGVAQETAVHAHLSATGAQAWALAKPMHGQGPFLGLTVREGVVCAYSVEARNQFTGSNVRGHLLLHVTDHARHPTPSAASRPSRWLRGRPTGSSGSLPGSRTRRPSWPRPSPPWPSPSWPPWSGPRYGSSIG